MHTKKGMYPDIPCEELRLEDEVESGDTDYLTRRAMCFEFCVLLA
jgi:hypothetical protein